MKFCEVHKAGGREGRAISAGHLYALAFDSGPISGAGFWDLGSGIPVLSCSVDCASCGGTGVFAGQIACDEDSQASISQSLPLAMAMPLSLTELDSLSLFRAVFPSLSRRPTPVSFGFSSSVSVGFAGTVSVVYLCSVRPTSFWLSVNMPFAFAISELHCLVDCRRGVAGCGPLAVSRGEIITLGNCS